MLFPFFGSCEQCCCEWCCAHTPSNFRNNSFIVNTAMLICEYTVYGCFPDYMNTCSCSVASGPTKPKILLIFYPFTEKACWSLVSMMGCHSEKMGLNYSGIFLFETRIWDYPMMGFTTKRTFIIGLSKTSQKLTSVGISSKYLLWLQYNFIKYI